MHSETEILKASATWVWFPRDSESLGDHLQLVRYPARFGGGVRASVIDSSLDAAGVVEHAIGRTRGWGERKLVFWVGAADAPHVEDELRRRGAVHDDTVTVFAGDPRGSDPCAGGHHGRDRVHPGTGARRGRGQRAGVGAAAAR